MVAHAAHPGSAYRSLICMAGKEVEMNPADEMFLAGILIGALASSGIWLIALYGGG